MRVYKYDVVWLLITVSIISDIPASAVVKDKATTDRGADSCTLTVIAHRGASGYVPEHTLGSYALAIVMGADYVEPDLVMTKDGKLIARHDNELGMTTDVAKHPEFADRHSTKTIDSNEITGWFTEDFTLEEIKKLRAIERIPAIRPGNARMDGSFQIPTFQEIIDLVKCFQTNQKRIVGIYPEIKHSTYFRNLELPMEEIVVDTFHRNEYRDASAPVYIQSFEVNNLKKLNKMTNLRLLQLYDDKLSQPFDQVNLSTNLTYGEMATPEGLAEVAKYADAVGPDKSYIIPRNANNTLGLVTTFVTDAHAVGLKVHAYTFRAENTFLPKEYQSIDPSEAALGDLSGEITAYLAAGIDGLFSDQPNIAVGLRGSCSN